eukprot:2771526-Rhodomonas_salina.1
MAFKFPASLRSTRPGTGTGRGVAESARRRVDSKALRVRRGSGLGRESEFKLSRCQWRRLGP